MMKLVISSYNVLQMADIMCEAIADPFMFSSPDQFGPEIEASGKCGNNAINW